MSGRQEQREKYEKGNGDHSKTRTTGRPQEDKSNRVMSGRQEQPGDHRKTRAAG